MKLSWAWEVNLAGLWEPSETNGLPLPLTQHPHHPHHPHRHRLPSPHRYLCHAHHQHHRHHHPHHGHRHYHPQHHPIITVVTTIFTIVIVITNIIVSTISTTIIIIVICVEVFIIYLGPLYRLNVEYSVPRSSPRGYPVFISNVTSVDNPSHSN